MQVFGDLQSHNSSFQHETADLSPVGEADVVVDRIMESCPQPRVLRLHCARIEIMRVAWKKPAEHRCCGTRDGGVAGRVARERRGRKKHLAPPPPPAPAG